MDVMFWQQNCREAATLLRVSVKVNTDLEFGDKVRCTVYFEDAPGVRVPLSGMTKDNVDAINWTVMGHFEMDTPDGQVGPLKLRVETELIKAPKYKNSGVGGSDTYYGGVSVQTYDTDIYEQIYT